MRKYRIDTVEFITGIFYMHSEDCKAYPGQFAALNNHGSCCDALQEARKLYANILSGIIIGCELCCCVNCRNGDLKSQTV